MQQTMAAAERAEHDPSEERRRRAFEANLKETLAEALGDALHPAARRTLVKTLGAAHADASHLIDARASFGSGERRWYVVLQFGFSLRSGPLADAAAGPLSERLLSLTPPEALADLSAEERRAVAHCIDRAEIRNRHPVDWRPRLRCGFGRLYLNVLAGRDKRGAAARAADDRRAPANERIGAAVLVFLAVTLAGMGLWLVAAAAFGLVDVLTDPATKDLLRSALDG